MSIVGRLGNLLKSYLNSRDDTEPHFYTDNDSDLKAAYDELNTFLGGGASSGAGGTRNREDPYRSTKENEQTYRPEPENRQPPEKLRKDFAELGVSFGADEETCKAARKKLLKMYHPDRYGGDEAGAKKALSRSAEINAAYDNICKWRS
jgi:hypothetical protein